jgi:LmbE family N-acetylglucosaminyl deacetylase
MLEGGLLAIFAHPDDETFGIGGTMARCAARGIPVTMLCATRGEVGEITPGSEATPDTLGRFREQELRDAMGILGVSDVRFLGFRDSGMQGSPENEDQRALVRAHPDAVTHMLVRAIRELRPDVVATWDESGGYGHPDHVAIHHHTTAAFNAAGDPTRFRTAGAPWQPRRLFYNAIPVQEFVRVMDEMRGRGIDVPSIAEGDDIMKLPRLEPNCVIDVTDVVEMKERAMLAHRTQISDMDPFMQMPEDLRRRFFGREYFYQAHPELAPGTMLDDLFAP